MNYYFINVGQDSHIIREFSATVEIMTSEQKPWPKSPVGLLLSSIGPSFILVSRPAAV